MWLLILEALAALGLLVFIVAWTMSGRRRSEDSVEEVAADPPPNDVEQRR
jgi:hypothetical protein